MITGVLEEKEGQLPLPNSSDCLNTIGQLAPEKVHHLLTGIFWCQAQHLIHSGAVLIPEAFYSQTSGYILPSRTRGCLACVNYNSCDFNYLILLYFVQPFTSQSSQGENFLSSFYHRITFSKRSKNHTVKDLFQ